MAVVLRMSEFAVVTIIAVVVGVARLARVFAHDDRMFVGQRVGIFALVRRGSGTRLVRLLQRTTFDETLDEILVARARR